MDAFMRANLLFLALAGLVVAVVHERWKARRNREVREHADDHPHVYAEFRHRQAGKALTFWFLTLLAVFLFGLLVFPGWAAYLAKLLPRQR